MRALRDLGYVEGRNLVLERRSLEGRWERAPELFADLTRLKVQVIVLSVNGLARAALRAGVSIPLVVLGGDLVEEGLVAPRRVRRLGELLDVEGSLRWHSRCTLASLCGLSVEDAVSSSSSPSRLEQRRLQRRRRFSRCLQGRP